MINSPTAEYAVEASLICSEAKGWVNWHLRTNPTLVLHMDTTESFSSHELVDLLTLIEEVHKASSPQQFRQVLLQGTGSLIASDSCAWTEISTDLFSDKNIQVNVVEITDDNIDTERFMVPFKAFVHQHPVVAHVIESGDKGANAISDMLERKAYSDLELYQQFYAPQNIEDQLSIGYVEHGQVKGLSVHRSSWGFSPKEHQLAERIAECTFSYYRALSTAAEDQPTAEPFIQINSVDFEQHFKLLGITHRQAELLNLVARGQSNKQIASALGLSEGTVRKHFENCFRRLGVQNRISAMTKSLTLIESESSGPNSD